MKIHQIRNATLVIEVAGQRILVDPMLAPRRTLPLLRLRGNRGRNPTVDLPAGSDVLLQGITACLITHCQRGHFDHLDGHGRRFLRDQRIPVYCRPRDVNHLRRAGLQVHALPGRHGLPAAFLDGVVETVPCTHGRGLVGIFMEHGAGYFLRFPNEPSLYLAGDTVFTEEVARFVRRAQPDVCVIPAGGARLDIGGEIIMGVDDAIAFARCAHGRVLANHLEALTHCGVSRAQLRQAAADAGLDGRMCIPEDGQCTSFP